MLAFVVGPDLVISVASIEIIELIDSTEDFVVSALAVDLDNN